MTPLSRPPRFARWILERVLPRDVRDDVSGDLEEMFHRRRTTAGPARARVWYWGQTASFAAHFFVERSAGSGHIDMHTGFSWIDFKLALRMLVRYPGLTLVGVLGMAVGIAISAGAFTIGQQLMSPRLPFPDGDRIVALQNWDLRTNNREQRVLNELPIWREEVDSLQEMGAFRDVGRNLIVPGAQPEAITAAEMSASGFRIAGVAPLIGRHLLTDDERAGAPEVVVIGEDVWRRRFAADPAIVGRQVHLGGTAYSIVGVMPAGFAFPVSHSFWIPWRVPAVHEPRTGPSATIFARLAPGATVEGARAELMAIGQRLAAASPRTHQHLQPRLTPYTHAFTDMDDPDNALALRLTQSLIVMLVIVVCVNVAILVYARTATRQGEIAVRAALGASRRRIVAQLFMEALVLAGAAAFVGVGLVSLAFSQLETALFQLSLAFPFWLDFRLSVAGAVYVAALAVLAAAIVGVVPALKATGRRVQSRLQGLSAGGGSKMQMGGVWTALIVGQVAVAVALLPATTFHTWSSLRFRMGDRGFPAQEFLTASLVVERSRDEGPSAESERDFRLRYGSRQMELERRLEAESAVSDVTFSMANPGEESAAVIEVEGMAPPPDPVDYNIVEGTRQGHFVRFNRVAADFFDAFDKPVLIGRGFITADTMPGADRIVVNRAFADRILAGESPLGRRLRYTGRSREAGREHVVLGRWYEIVGVVPDFPAGGHDEEGSAARIYHAAAPADVYPATLAVRVRDASASAFADRLRAIGAAVDPNLQLRGLATADDASKREQGLMRLIGATLAAVTLSVVVLAAAGIYALMSFTVARRRKEIGIRAALGAEPRRILAGIFSRVFGQLGIGAALGMTGAIALEGVLEGEMFQGNGVIVLPLVALFTMAVGLLAALGPARRGLRIQPTEALREE